jgi:hypothetical protein
VMTTKPPPSKGDLGVFSMGYPKIPPNPPLRKGQPQGERGHISFYGGMLHKR